MASGDRQRIIETNRSLRIIKNELEALFEKGIISDAAFDSINDLLPTESDISSAHTPAQRAAAHPAPSPAPSEPPVSALNNLTLNQHAHAPPSYNQSTAANNGPPPLPGRNQPPPPPPGKPVLAYAKALYAYAASDARDCSFERGDRIAVYEYMNADWSMGRNLRTGLEGIFPKSYVEPETPAAAAAAAPHSWNNGWNEKAPTGGYPGANAPYQPPAQPQYSGGGGYMAPPPGPMQGNPYNANAPPMAVAEQGSEGGAGGSKMGETGKKLGKKLGNAAIFGAGATIGSNLVNSIF
ncbi:SH3 domain-containing protein [Podospora appendiculata]|uniref:SH3 domain-containing protein n=1 Tax=Podospora appendiculata TaxID=314037 RepID=A0AAE0XL24_9PEZI|nr:SH3 domain-containing protein [Podospora appendiculata]